MGVFGRMNGMNYYRFIRPCALVLLLCWNTRCECMFWNRGVKPSFRNCDADLVQVDFFQALTRSTCLSED